jgi:hypothetical protein
MTRLRRAELLVSFGAALSLVILLSQIGGQPLVRTPLPSLTNGERLVDVQTFPVTRRMVKHMVLH